MAPPTAAWLQLYFQSDQEGILLIDDIEVVRATSCQTIATPTVTVSTATLAMAVPTVSSCIDHPIQDVATVSAAVSWSNAPVGDKIKVTLNNKIEIIDVAGGATSPTTVTFMVPANSATNQTITATWLNTTGCSASRTFNAPAPVQAIRSIATFYTCADWINQLTEMPGIMGLSTTWMRSILVLSPQFW